MFDVLQIVFWGITYLLIFLFSIKNREKKIRAISLLPPILNFSWEINALIISQGFWGHIVWLGLDTLVVASCIMFCSNRKQVLEYLMALLIGSIIFNLIYCLNMGMLISSFVIDFIMAICFWVDRKKLLVDGKIVIAATKLLGDLFAAIHYAPFSAVILVIGICVFGFNIAYLVYAIKEKYGDNSACN